MQTTDRHAHFVAQGWTVMFLVFIAIFQMEFIAMSVNADISTFQSPEGRQVFKAAVVLMALHAFMPLLVCSLTARWFRWGVVLVTAFFTVAMVGHQWAHVVKGDKPVALLHLLDLCHHVISAWVTVAAVRWARSAPAR